MTGRPVYVTAQQAIERLGWCGVTAVVMRDWKRRTLIHEVRDPQGRKVTMPSPSGPQNVYLWDELVEVEYSTSEARTGRKRST